MTIKIIGKTNLSLYKHQIIDLASEWSLDDFWSGDEVISTLEHGHSELLVESDRKGAWQGLVFLQMSPPVADLLYIYVTPSARGKSLGTMLLSEAMAYVISKGGLDRILLEVKPSNQAAIKLYEKIGFVLISKRRNYYKSGEDAHIYQLLLSAQVDKT